MFRRERGGESTYLQHESVFNVEHYLLLLSVVSYEGVDSVTVGYPADETRVGGEGDDRVALNAARIEVRGGGRGGGGEREEGGGTGEDRTRKKRWKERE